LQIFLTENLFFRVRELSGEKNTTCNSLLLSYVRYVFDPPQIPDTVHEVLCTHWFDFLEERPELKNLEEGETWIMLNIMLKSMFLKICENGPPVGDARLTAFPTTFAKKLEELVLTLFCVEKEIRNMDILTMVPLFMKDLLGIIDRGVVFEMVRLWFSQVFVVFFFRFSDVFFVFFSLDFRLCLLA
jgi:hypothetical protein